MSDYSNMSIEDLEDLKKNLLNQISNLNNTIRFKIPKLVIGFLD